MLRRGEGRTWWLLVAVALLLTPLVPGPSVTVRSERDLYRGPDMLSPEPEVTEVLAEEAVVPGLAARRTVRTTQGGTLLREVRRLDVVVPWLLLLVAAGWLATRIRRRGPPGSAWAAGLALVLAGGLAGCVAREEGGPTLAETRLVELLEMRRTGEVERAADVFDPVAVYADYPNQVEYRGLPEIAEYLQGLHRWADGVFLDVSRIHVAEAWAAAEWVLEGEQSAPFPGVADSATFRRFRMEGVTVVELERGLVVRAADYADMVPLILGLGGSVTLPSGEVVAERPPSGEGS